MRTAWTAVILVGLALPAWSKPLTLCVSPTGDDSADGVKSPLATFAGARDRIREMKEAGEIPSGGVVVQVDPGVYEFAETLELTSQDSGTLDSPIVYRARNKKEVRLLGGRRISGFRPVENQEDLSQLLPEARDHVLQCDLQSQGVTEYGSPAPGGMELFFKNEPQTLSRWPNQGFVKIKEMVGEATKRDRHTTHTVGKWVYEGERPKRWSKEKDPWVHGYWFHDWSEQRHRVKEIDTERRTIEVEPPYHGYGYKKGKWYYAFNLLSEIDTPGEWYLEREGGILYFWPPNEIQEGEAVVSMIPGLISAKDVSHVTFEGFLFDASRGTALRMVNGEANRVVRCTFRNLGGWAVSVSGGKDCGVVGCDVFQTGQGGISLSGGVRGTLEPGRHFAENNHVHHYARVQRVYKPGITLHGVGNRASHNLIHNAPHMAMGFGGNDHLIEFNEIHSVCYESNDAGAIYTGRDWTCRGNVIRNNYLHHINGFEGRGCVGVYLDDAFSSASIIGNVFYKVTRAAMIGGGRDNEIVNNIFVDCVPAIHVDARGIGWANRYIVPGGGWRMQEKLAALPYQNPPWTKYPHLANILEDDPYLPKYNVIVRNLFVGGKWDGIHEQARPYQMLKDNLIDVDVHFVTKDEADFRLKKDSPAFDVGFEVIPVEKIGLTKDRDRASWPVKHEVRPMAVRPAKPKRGPAPRVRVRGKKTSVEIDGTLSHAEWDGLDPKKALVIEQGIQGQTLSPQSWAWILCDGECLYVGIRNAVSSSSPLRTEAEWGSNDAVEVAVRSVELEGKPILLLRGYPGGQFEASGEAGAAKAVLDRLQARTTYQAKVLSKEEWCAEWRISLDALGVSGSKSYALPFNLSVRKTAGPDWLMWRGTGGYTWKVDEAGVLELSP